MIIAAEFSLPQTGAGWALSILILIGALPIISTLIGYLLVIAHSTRSHYSRADPTYQPRIAVVVPAWNEAAVLVHSIDRMMALDYPADRLRLVVVDDASTDATPQILAAAAQKYPGRVLPLRRDQGGQGKAHTLNHGLATVLADDWAQAVLITDADVVFRLTAIGQMARHLADPEVGAVTAFIREASEPPNWLNRSIGYEYATAQLAARRAQNVVGAQACLAGGAQLLSRHNLEAVGGRIDTSSLAEDTITTLLTQLDGRRVVFDPRAECLAEEPASVTGLWKQRLRWSRGNLQVTSRFHRVFFRPHRQHHLGNWWFGLQWYSTLFLPAFMVLASIGLTLMWFFDRGAADLLFQTYWGLSALAFVFTTTLTLLLDGRLARRSWWQALTFPGLINLFILAWVMAPGPLHNAAEGLASAAGMDWDDATRDSLMLGAYLWTSLCMVAAWLVYRLDRLRAPSPLVALGVLVVGFGPLLCAVTFAAYVAQARGAATTWDKTEKTGKVGVT